MSVFASLSEPIISKDNGPGNKVCEDPVINWELTSLSRDDRPGQISMRQQDYSFLPQTTRYITFHYSCHRRSPLLSLSPSMWMLTTMWPLDFVVEYLNHRTINASKDPATTLEPASSTETDPSQSQEVDPSKLAPIEEEVDYGDLYMPFLTEGETPLVDQDKLVEEINLLLSQYAPDTFEPTLDPCHLPLERHTVLATPPPSGNNTPQNPTPTGTCSERSSEGETQVEILDVTKVAGSDEVEELQRRQTIRLVTPASPQGPRPLRKMPRKPIPSFDPISRPNAGFALFNRNRPLPTPPPVPQMAGALPQSTPATRKRTLKRIYVGKRDAYPSIASLVVERVW